MPSIYLVRPLGLGTYSSAAVPASACSPALVVCGTNMLLQPHNSSSCSWAHIICSSNPELLHTHTAQPPNLGCTHTVHYRLLCTRPLLY